MEMWRGWTEKLQQLVDGYQHKKETDLAVSNLQKEWQQFQDRFPNVRLPLVHIESLLTQATRTLVLVTDPMYAYLEKGPATDFFKTELHDLNFCTPESSVTLRKDFSFLWLQKHWLLCSMIEANNQAIQNPIRTEHFNGSPLPYPHIPHEVRFIHGLLEIHQTGIATERRKALEQVMKILKPTKETA